MNQYQLRKTAIALAASQIALLAAGSAMGQTQSETPAVVVVTGQRAALQSAQAVKRNSDEIVDSIVAEDIGKLPDRPHHASRCSSKPAPSCRQCPCSSTWTSTLTHRSP